MRFLEQYIPVLYNLADICKFQELKEEMSQDRLVVASESRCYSNAFKWIHYLTEKLKKIM